MLNTKKIAQKTITTYTEPSLLEQVINATKQTERSKTEILLKALTKEALKGTITWDKNVVVTLNKAINSIDEIISKQLAKIMHHEKFKKLEGTWRGLHYLVTNTETSHNLHLKVLNLSKDLLCKDINKAADFDQSLLFKKIYEHEFGTPGGQPYAALVGDYEFTHHPEDIEALHKIANIAAAGFCPFIASAGPALFGFDHWTTLSKPRDLETIFDTTEYTQWRRLRESEDSRFITLTMPRALARLPYGLATKPVEEFSYEEGAIAHNDYCWMNAAYVFGARLTDAFTQYGWCTSIRGTESGGRVNNLPLHTFNSDNGDISTTCPTEIAITDRREMELSKLGFLPLCHYKNTDYAVFFGAQTIQKARKYDRPEATANAAVATRLPYVMATARFAHYLKIMARDKIGSFMDVSDVEIWLNRWILNYVNGNPGSGQEMKAKYPLAAAKIQVEAIPGKPGAYHAVTWLRPWLQLEELTTSLRLVANIPAVKN